MITRIGLVGYAAGCCALSAAGIAASTMAHETRGKRMSASYSARTRSRPVTIAAKSRRRFRMRTRISGGWVVGHHRGEHRLDRGHEVVYEDDNILYVGPKFE